jgi:hypothetical protein
MPPKIDITSLILVDLVVGCGLTSQNIPAQIHYGFSHFKSRTCPQKHDRGGHILGKMGVQVVGTSDDFPG